MKPLREKFYTIPGHCVPLARARVSHGRCYDSQKHLKLVAGIHLRNQHKDEPLFESKPLQLEVTFFIEIPKTRIKHVHENDPHFYKPDTDNMLKFLNDVANKLIWVDDSLVCSIIAKKVYSSRPRTEFTVRELK